MREPWIRCQYLYYGNGGTKPVPDCGRSCPPGTGSVFAPLVRH